MDNRKKITREFNRLLDIIDELRVKCPWDMKQTNESLRKLTIEETYELSEAVFSGKDESIKNELGDLMLHIVFYAKIGAEKGAFTMAEVLEGINSKLIYRHPHVFGEVKVSGASEVEENWEQLKIREDKCVICWDDYSVGEEIRTLSCGGKHFFHHSCIDQWLSKYSKCPVCSHVFFTETE